MPTDNPEFHDQNDEDDDADATAEVVHLPVAAQPDTMPALSANELSMIERQASTLASSDIVPSAYRKKPANIVVAALTGRAFGWDPLTSMRQGHVIEGSWSLRPEAMLGLIRRRGHSVTIDRRDRGVTVTGRRLDTGDTMVATFGFDDAVRAGLCTIKDGHPFARSSSGKPLPWEQYPIDMCQWRAVAQLGRGLFSDCTLGLSYIPEELGAFVDASGDIIDVPAIEMGSSADPAVLDDLAVRVAALPEEHRSDLAAKWKASERLSPHKLAEMPESAVSLARAMISGFEALARRGGWDAEQARADVLAARAAAAAAAQGPAEPAAEPSGQQEADEAPAEPAAPESPASGDAERSAAAPDPGFLTWVRSVISGADPALVDRTAAEVKEMHHAPLDRALRARGYEPSGQHIDTRRMALTTLRLLHAELPEQCEFLACDEPGEEGADGTVWCAEHLDSF